MKQLSLMVLPSVLTFQLKRFNFSPTTSTKNEAIVSLPLTLDMTPHTARYLKSRAILTSNLRPRSAKLSEFEAVVDSNPSFIYNLYCVIVHEGKIDTGHYKAYCKVNKNWFLFDDQNVTMASARDVLNAGAYMAFYLKENLEII